MKSTFATLVAFLSAYTAAAPVTVEETAAKLLSDLQKYGGDAQAAAEPLVAEVEKFGKPVVDDLEKYGQEVQEAFQPFVEGTEKFAKPVTDEIENAAGEFGSEVQSGFADATDGLKALENFKRDGYINGQKAGGVGISLLNNAADHPLDILKRDGDINDQKADEVTDFLGLLKRDHIVNDQEAGGVGISVLNNAVDHPLDILKRDNIDAADALNELLKLSEASASQFTP